VGDPERPFAQLWVYKNPSRDILVVMDKKLGHFLNVFP